METQLLVKHLPSDFSEQDKCEFMQMFGASDVICLPNHGQMRRCCLAMFSDAETTRQALTTLHQFEVLGQRLVAEFAKPAHIKLANGAQARKVLQKTSNVTKQKQTDEISKDDEEKNREEDEDGFDNGINPKLGVAHNFPPHLRYSYPPPTVATLTNIANALATVPRLYTQVLHLMNRMNLPPPFTDITPTPPLPDDKIVLQDASVDTTDLAEYFASSDESELESDTEERKADDTSLAQKDKLYSSTTTSEPVPKRRRLKYVLLREQEKKLAAADFLVKSKSMSETVETAFELPAKSKRASNLLSASIQQAVERKNSPSVSYSIFDEREPGFGRIEPSRRIEQQPDEYDEEDEESLGYISARKLFENRISAAEITAMSQFKNYTSGEPTNRLYIKNLAKQASQEDLEFVFKRFVCKHAPDRVEELEIRLMQEGRMKGQSFITFPTEEIAEKALDAAHGYILHSKPMVIQFARSTAQK